MSKGQFKPGAEGYEVLNPNKQWWTLFVTIGVVIDDNR